MWTDTSKKRRNAVAPTRIGVHSETIQRTYRWAEEALQEHTMDDAIDDTIDDTMDDTSESWVDATQRAPFKVSCGRHFGEFDAVLWTWPAQDLNPCRVQSSAPSSDN